MHIQVQYFAALREQRGLNAETLETQARTAGDLYEVLRQRHNFSLTPNLVRASINLRVLPLETELAEGDEVVFIPPVAGG